MRAIIEHGISYVEIDDEAWANATFTEYVAGMPFLVRRP